MKTLLTVIALSAATVLTTQAQDTERPATRSTETVQSQPEQDMNTRVRTQTDRMIKDLDLNDEQSRQMMERNTRYYTDMDALRSDRLKAEDRDARMDRSMSAYDNDLSNILDEDQYKKYSTMKEDYRRDAYKSEKMEKAPMQRDINKSDKRRK